MISSIPLHQAQDFLQFANQLADAAAKITLPLFRKPLPVKVKSDASPFTQADCNSEKTMCELIAKNHPTHGIIGEEFGSNNADADYVWVLDPIDGTRSFISGSPLYSTLIVLLHKGVPVISVMDFPALSERWTGLLTEQSKYAEFNGTRCHTASSVPLLPNCVISTTTAALEHRPEDTQLQKFMHQCAHVRLGGDGFSYACLSSGFVHLALDYLMQPYDYLPLIPVITGAGGVISDWQGKPLIPFGSKNAVGDGTSTVVASANEQLHQEALQTLASCF